MDTTISCIRYYITCVKLINRFRDENPKPRKYIGKEIDLNCSNIPKPVLLKLWSTDQEKSAILLVLNDVYIFVLLHKSTG